MDTSIYTYAATYLVTRLGILAVVGYLVYITLRPAVVLSRIKK